MEPRPVWNTTTLAHAMRAAASSHAHGRLARFAAAASTNRARPSPEFLPLSIDQSANGTAPPPAPARPDRPEHVTAAIGLMLAATFVFTCTSALSKWLIETYPIGEVLFSRVFIPLIGLSIIILPQRGLAVFHTKRLNGHLLRGVSQSTSQTFLMIAFSLMPLASAVAINFSAPIFATLASMIFLREHVGFARWAAILVGFFGVLIVTSPGTETFTIGALFALANAVMYGTLTAGVRGLTATEFDRRR